MGSTPRLTDAEIQEALAVCEKATPGPITINRYGRAEDASGEILRMCGVSLATGIVDDDDVGYANTKLLALSLSLLPRALEELREERRDTEWRSMDTAPRDGTTVLVAFRCHGVMSVRWTESVTGIDIWCVDDHKFGPHALRGYAECDCLGWRPLPVMPEVAIDAARGSK